MLRTIAVWNKKLYIVIPLCLISLGQWGILLHGVTTVKAFFDPVTQSCQVAAVESLFLNLVYLWSELPPSPCCMSNLVSSSHVHRSHRAYPDPRRSTHDPWTIATLEATTWRRCPLLPCRILGQHDPSRLPADQPEPGDEHRTSLLAIVRQVAIKFTL
jgi:hypothetical protein